MPKKITKIHDKFFKRIFKDLELAKDFFVSFLDKEVLELIELDSIQASDTTFINEELEEAFADVLFSFQLKGGDGKVYISILLEHKSNIDKYTPVQVLYYLAHTYYSQVKDGQPLQFVLPLVYYHGEDEWIYQPLSDLFSNLPKYLHQFVPNHQTEFVDLYRVSDKELSVLSNFLLVSALLTQKYSRKPKALFEKINLIFGSINKGRKENLIEVIIVYYLQLIKEQNVLLREVINPLPEPVKNIFMSTYDMILSEGLEKGLEKGIQKGMQKGIQKGIERGTEKKSIITIANLLALLEIPVDQIAEVTNVDCSYVEFIKSKLDSGDWVHPKNWTEQDWEAYFEEK